MSGGLRQFRRAVVIARTLARHDAFFPLERLGVPRPLLRVAAAFLLVRRSGTAFRPGERLKTALTELGPAFVKIGQALSVRPDLIGDEIADDLSSLRDRMPAFDGAEALAAVEAELGERMSERFSFFDHEAVAAASIAQVHRAVTTDGVQVAVKVLRPGIEAAFARDLELARWTAGMMEKFSPDLRRLRPLDVADTIIRTVEIEMDLRLEAAAADELRENLADEPGFRVPEVDWSRSGRRVLTTRWVEAAPIHDLPATPDGPDPRTVVANFSRVFFLQVFRDGFFHADLHSGNLFVDPHGVVHAVDFGIMGRLDRPTRRYLAEMLYGFLTRDYLHVANVHLRAGYVPAHHSAEEFAQAARAIAEPVLGLPLNRISLARLLAQLFAVTERFDMRTQPQLLLLQKTMLVAEGVGRKLCPDVNMWELARPLIEDWMRSNAGPEARIRETANTLLNGLERLPHLMGELEKKAGSRNASAEFRRKAPWPVWIAAAAVVFAGLIAL